MAESNEAPEVAEQLSEEQLEEVGGGLGIIGNTVAAALNMAGAVALNPEPVEIGSPVGQGLVAGTG